MIEQKACTVIPALDDTAVRKKKAEVKNAKGKNSRSKARKGSINSKLAEQTREMNQSDTGIKRRAKLKELCQFNVAFKVSSSTEP